MYFCGRLSVSIATVGLARAAASSTRLLVSLIKGSLMISTITNISIVWAQGREQQNKQTNETINQTHSLILPFTLRSSKTDPQALKSGSILNEIYFQGIYFDRILFSRGGCWLALGSTLMIYIYIYIHIYIYISFFIETFCDLPGDMTSLKSGSAEIYF